MHATTGDFLAADDWMEVRCRKCRRVVWIGGDMIRKCFPVSTPIDQARRRMKCKQCGSKMPTVTIKPPFRHEIEGDRISFGGRLA